MATSTINKRAQKLSKTKTSRVIFYSLLIAIPVIHFLVFYVYINFNSIVLALKEYKLADMGGYVSSFVGFKNFAAAWKELGSRMFLIKNSLIFLASDCLIVTPLAVLFSFYIYKKALLSGFFKVFLFMPQLLSGVILGLLYKYISADVYLWFADKTGMEVSGGLLDMASTQLGATLAFNIFIGFGVNILLFVGAMGGVNISILESAEIDGASPLQELWYIILPMIFTTIVTVLIVYISHIFTNQYNMYTLFGNGAGRTSTLGYFLYVQAMESALVAPRENVLSYPVLAAIGIILTAIILPITMFFRYLMNKYGPSTD